MDLELHSQQNHFELGFFQEDMKSSKILRKVDSENELF
jgi:hypothetical protein